jgi:hypothetical protein
MSEARGAGVTRPRGRLLAFRIVTLVIGAAFGLAAAEAGIRLSGLSAAGGLVTVSERDFSRVPGIFEPGQDVVDRRIPALTFRVRINSLGYRGAEFPLIKPERQLRVLMAGDSFTFGDFVEDDESLPGQLQRALQCRLPSLVINAGVGGASIRTERHMIERGLAVSPDLVVLTYYENDIADLEDPLWERLQRNRDAKSRLPLSVIYPIVKDSALWSLVNDVQARWRGRRRLDRNGAPRPVADSDAGARQESLRSAYAREFTDVVALLRARKIPLMLATYPSHLSLRAPAASANTEWVEALGESLGTQVVRLRTALEDSGLATEDLYALPLDGHPRARAHEIAAAFLADAIGQRMLSAYCGNS